MKGSGTVTSSATFGHRLNGDTGQKFIKETLPAVAAFGCVGASDAVGKLKHGHDRRRRRPSNRASVPSGRLQRLPMGGDGRFDIFSEVGVDGRCRAGRHQGDALGDFAAHGFRGADHSHRLRVTLDDDLGSGLDPLQD